MFMMQGLLVDLNGSPKGKLLTFSTTWVKLHVIRNAELVLLCFLKELWIGASVWVNLDTGSPVNWVVGLGCGGGFCLLSVPCHSGPSVSIGPRIKASIGASGGFSPGQIASAEETIWVQISCGKRLNFLTKDLLGAKVQIWINVLLQLLLTTK